MTGWTVLHGGALGDLALTLRLALRLPGVKTGSTVDLVSRTDPGDLSTCRPEIRRIPPEGLGLHWLHAEGDDPPPARLREIVAGRRVLNALGAVDSIVHRRLRTLGTRNVYSFDPRPKPNLDTHITTQWQRELERQGLRFPKHADQNRDSTGLLVPDEMGRIGRAALAKVGVGGRSILVHPGGGGRAKCWPLRCFLEVAHRLRDKNADVCFLVGPVEVERWSPEDLDASRLGFPLIEAPTPNELLALLGATKTLLSNDAGPAHLAALLGTPTVTVFGPTSPTIWRPLGPTTCCIRGDPQSHPNDWNIDPQRVIENVVI